MSISIVERWSENVPSPLFALIGLVTLTFDLLTSKWVHGILAWCYATILPIFGFLGLSVLELSRGTGWDGQTDRQTDTVAQFIMPPPSGRGHNKKRQSSGTQLTLLVLTAPLSGVSGPQLWRFVKGASWRGVHILWVWRKKHKVKSIKAQFPLPELTARVNGPSWRVTGFHYPSTRAVLTGCQHGPSTRL